MSSGQYTPTENSKAKGESARQVDCVTNKKVCNQVNFFLNQHPEDFFSLKLYERESVRGRHATVQQFLFDFIIHVRLPHYPITSQLGLSSQKTKFASILESV